MTRPTTTTASLIRFAQHLASESIGVTCELGSLVDRGRRCSGPAVAVRWADGFADDLCEEHAARVEEREPDALVVRPRRHDGTVDA